MDVRAPLLVGQYNPYVICSLIRNSCLGITDFRELRKDSGFGEGFTGFTLFFTIRRRILPTEISASARQRFGVEVEGVPIMERKMKKKNRT